MESVPEKRFSGQNLAVCFWIVIEDLSNILFRQKSVNSEQKESAVSRHRSVVVFCGGPSSFHVPSPPIILSKLPYAQTQGPAGAPVNGRCNEGAGRKVQGILKNGKGSQESILIAESESP
jgi:hypothetical protein